jgi:hypothetical protein
MALFIDMRLTVAGRNLMAEAIATGSALIIESVAIGDGFMPDGVTREDMTELVSPLVNADIIARRFTGFGAAVIRGRINSSQITADLTVRELGLMARLDGSSVPAITFGYDNAGDDPGSIPYLSGAGYVSHVFDIITLISNAANVVINVTAGSTLTMVSDSFTTTEGQRDFTLINTDILGVLSVYIEGAKAQPGVDWVQVGGMIRLSQPLPAGRRVWVEEILADGVGGGSGGGGGVAGVSSFNGRTGHVIFRDEDAPPSIARNPVATVGVGATPDGSNLFFRDRT